jgi:NitT/TauT family transport system substrate-binding protein
MKNEFNFERYESYATGVALASAMARGDIDVPYVCLIPAINAFANAGVKFKVVCGTHKYGYGLIVNDDKIKTVLDLETAGLKIGCPAAGSSADVLLNKTIDKYNLNSSAINNNIRRMDPTKQLLAIKAGQLDAAVMPEQWATMGESCGFSMLLTSQQIWPGMQGSVLVVKDNLRENHPDIVKNLVAVTRKATEWAVENPQETAELVCNQMQNTILSDGSSVSGDLTLFPDMLLTSMQRMELTTEIDPAMINSIIDYMYRLGYIKESFDSSQLLDLSYL